MALVKAGTIFQKNSMILKIKKIHQNAKIPKYALPGDAGMDLFSVENLSIKPGSIEAIKTGITVDLPEGSVGLIWDKSGLALKSGIKVMGGVIDSGYRGEIAVIITNLSNKEHQIKVGDKIAQMLIQKVEQPKIVETDELSKTERNRGGFGSTGSK